MSCGVLETGIPVYLYFRAFTLIEMDVFPGRSIEAKRKLYQSIVHNLEFVGIHPMDVLMVLKEIPLDNWGLRGGLPASEIDLGFKLDV